jgi:peroxiredoxin
VKGVKTGVSRLSSTTLRIGDSAPPFSLPTLDGTRYQLGDALRDRIGLLVFVPGSWSPSARHLIAELNTFHAAFLQAGIVAVMIITQDASSLRRRLETRPPFPVLIDQDRSVVRDYGVFRALSWDGIGVTRPAAFMVDPEGAIRFLYVGERDSDVPDVASLLRLAAWLRGEAPLPAEPDWVERPADALEATQAVAVVAGVAQQDGGVTEPGDGAAIAADDGKTTDASAEPATTSDDAPADVGVTAADAAPEAGAIPRDGQADADLADDVVVADGPDEPPAPNGEASAVSVVDGAAADELTAGAAEVADPDAAESTEVADAKIASDAQGADATPVAEDARLALVVDDAQQASVAESAGEAPELPPPPDTATQADVGVLDGAETRRPTATGTAADH